MSYEEDIRTQLIFDKPTAILVLDPQTLRWKLEMYTWHTVGIHTKPQIKTGEVK